MMMARDGVRRSGVAPGIRSRDALRITGLCACGLPLVKTNANGRPLRPPVCSSPDVVELAPAKSAGASLVASTLGL
jgi:hypothetical protein